VVTWRILIQIKDANIYNKIKDLNITLEELKMCYYLRLVDDSGVTSKAYLKIKDIDINASGSRNNRRITWDDIYQMLLINRLYIKSYVGPNFKYINLSPETEKVNCLMCYLVKGDHITIVDLTKAYQNNYDLYAKLLIKIRSMIRLNALILNLEQGADICAKLMESHTPEENMEDLKAILEDLKFKIRE
jgi:hypothetical protein